MFLKRFKLQLPLRADLNSGTCAKWYRAPNEAYEEFDVSKPLLRHPEESVENSSAQTDWETHYTASRHPNPHYSNH